MSTPRRPLATRAVAAGIGAIVVGVAVWLLVARDSGSKPAHQPAGPVAANVVEGADLGELKDDASLRAAVEPRVFASTSSVARHRSSQATWPCEREARALQPGTEVLVYRATATWQGTSAVVLGFSPPAAPAPSSRRPPTRVYVLARSGCRLLSFQSYAP